MLLVEPNWVTATKGFRHGYFPHRTRQRIESNSAKPICSNGTGFVIEEGHGHTGHRTLALLQALPLATSGNLGTQVNTMA